MFIKKEIKNFLMNKSLEKEINMVNDKKTIKSKI